MINIKYLIFDLFTFGCYSSYQNIKKIENHHKILRDKLFAEYGSSFQSPSMFAVLKR